jgi:membrane protein
MLSANIQGCPQRTARSAAADKRSFNRGCGTMLRELSRWAFAIARNNLWLLNRVWLWYGAVEMADDTKIGGVSRFDRIKLRALNLWEDKGFDWRDESRQPQLLSFLHFWLLVGKSFVRNRCPTRAAALAYTTLLALIPVLAVAASIAISFLQKDGEKTIRAFIDKGVAYVAPSLDLEVKAQDADAKGGRELVAARIAEYVNNISSGTLGVTSSIALIFVAIQMLRGIEGTFNDIWGVTRGRTWLASIIQYWAVISLGPLVVLVAMAFTSGPHLSRTFAFVGNYPILSTLVFSVLPFLMLSLAFALFYMFMPNTRVRFSAALMGGLVTAFLWQLNSLLNALYASRVVSYSQIYGSLGLVPLFLIGIYLSWLFLLFGAQVAYAYQNRQAYLQERVAENVNQKGREFAALRLMTMLAQKFSQGERPPTATELGQALGLPTRLATQLLAVLIQAGLVAEVVGRESAFAPAKPLAAINCADILHSLRTCGGQELDTQDDAFQSVVKAELDRIGQAEHAVASTVTLEKLVKQAGA